MKQKETKLHPSVVLSHKFILHHISTPYAGCLFENKAKDNPDKNWKQKK